MNLMNKDSYFEQKNLNTFRNLQKRMVESSILRIKINIEQ